MMRISVLPRVGVLCMLSMLVATPATHAQSAGVAATRFTPVAGDDSVRKLADSLGDTPEDRQALLQLAGAGKELFATKYKGRGWDNTLAGAMTFFIASAYIVNTDQQPGIEAENALFASLSDSLAKSEIARASNAEKTALYNALLASAGLPLVFYVDGKQNHNATQVEQARTMAAGFGSRLLHMDLPAMTALLQSPPAAGAPAATPQATASKPSASGRCVAARTVMVPNYVYAPPMGMQMVQKQELRYVEVPCDSR